MRIVRDPKGFPADAFGGALVPTMGALHEGHFELIRAAKRESDQVTVSIFVNPTQFGPSEDFERYPRPFEKDIEQAEKAGADLIFTPDVAAMYPHKTTTIHVSELTDRWEGALRPGHFDGVATVVCKLFNVVRPRIAIFGWKDLQQCIVLRRMVEDLNMSVQLSFWDTIRESDGLAKSSRNVYLNAEDRAKAPLLYATLQNISSALKNGVPVSQSLISAKATLSAAGFQLDYLELVDLEDLMPLERLNSSCALIVAGRIGSTRLIDNLRL